MTVFYIILQMALIFALSIIIFLVYDKWLDIRENRRLRKNELLELCDIVTRTTPLKDDELRLIYKSDKEALDIINNAEKDFIHASMCVSQDLPEDDTNVFEMDRREQMSKYLETKRALRRGEIQEMDAKIVNFDR